MHVCDVRASAKARSGCGVGRGSKFVPDFSFLSGPTPPSAVAERACVEATSTIKINTINYIHGPDTLASGHTDKIVLYTVHAR